MRPFRIPHSTFRNRRRAAGVTLVEVVIAIFVLTVGVIGIISLFPAGYKLGQQAFDRSVASLAARDALVRIMGAARSAADPDTFYPDTTSTSETLCYRKVTERERVGTVYAVNAHTLECNAGPNTGPSRWASNYVAGYYCVMTSGTATGRAYLINSSTYSSTTKRGILTFSSSGTHAVTFRTVGSTTGDTVRVGDHFAIIGSKTGRKCYPTNFLSAGSSNRTAEIATHGKALRGSGTMWEYGYGCIITPPSDEMRGIYRVDVFVYRGFDPTGTLEQQEHSPAGHFVTYLARLDDYDNP